MVVTFRRILAVSLLLAAVAMAGAWAAVGSGADGVDLPHRAFVPDTTRDGDQPLLPSATATATDTPTATGTPTPTAPAASATPTVPPSFATPTRTPTVVPTPYYVTVVVTHGENEGTVLAEVAETPAKRSQGLMFREYLPPDEGMVFLFPNNHSGCFWMKNTPIPLDIAFIRSDGEVIIIHEGVPFSTDPLCPPSGQTYRNALEVNYGWFEAHGLGVGSVVEIQP